MNLLLHVLGIDDPAGRWYLFWSGAGADLGYLSVAAAVWRRHNCHQPRCLRIGRHVVDGTSWCGKHHGLARDGGPAFMKLRDKTPLPPA